MKWFLWLLGGLAAAGCGAIYYDFGHECGRHARFTSLRPTRGFCRGAPAPPHVALHVLAAAQADFRANDRDGDGDKNFWRADIAGLYALAPGGGPAIKLAPLWI